MIEVSRLKDLNAAKLFLGFRIGAVGGRDFAVFPVIPRGCHPEASAELAEGPYAAKPFHGGWLGPAHCMQSGRSLRSRHGLPLTYGPSPGYRRAQDDTSERVSTTTLLPVTRADAHRSVDSRSGRPKIDS